MGKNILQTIAATKRMEVEAMKGVIPMDIMQRLAMESAHSPLDMRKSLLSDRPGIIPKERSHR